MWKDQIKKKNQGIKKIKRLNLFLGQTIQSLIFARKKAQYFWFFLNLI